MRILMLYGIMLLTFCSCKAQEKVTLRYIGYQYKETKNESFINNELTFIKDKDTVKANVKVPFDDKNTQIINRGIFYNCHLKKGKEYTFTLKKICATDIPETFNSYYKTNVIPDKKECSKFTEVKRNTEYNYTGNYGKYIDIDGVLYEVIGISPDDSCFYPH